MKSGKGSSQQQQKSMRQLLRDELGQLQTVGVSRARQLQEEIVLVDRFIKETRAREKAAGAAATGGSSAPSTTIKLKLKALPVDASLLSSDDGMLSRPFHS